MPLPRRRISLLLSSVIAFSLIGAPAVAARSISSANAPTAIAPAAFTGAATLTNTLPRRIDLPDGFMPEGIESGPFGRLYVGSRADGAIWKGNAYTGSGRILVEGVEGRFAAGVYLDWRNRLWVAGGGNGTVRVYNARTGDLLRTYQFPTPSFINDLTIVDNKVYATNSLNQYLAVVPLGRYRAPARDRQGEDPGADRRHLVQRRLQRQRHHEEVRLADPRPVERGAAVPGQPADRRRPVDRYRRLPRRPTATASRSAIDGSTSCATRTTSSPCSG